jgi:S1-C subfamily serine protease
MMFRMFLPVVLLVVAIVAQSLPTFAAPQSELPTLSQCKELVESALPTIVQFSYDGFGNGQLHFGCGVIVSPEGLVVVSGPVGAVLDNRLLELRLSDGRQVAGEALGWSSEFGFGVLKITEPGKWPFVKLSEQIQVGEVCLALGYPLNHDAKNHRPENRLALVTRVSKDAWFTTSHRSKFSAQFSAHPVFNMHGELLGLGVGGPVGGDAVHNSASVIKRHWNELATGRNLDRKRLLDETKPPQTYGKLPEKMSEETLAKVKAASVQIGNAGEKPFFSGVIIPDRYVITCAHHKRLPSAKLMVTLPDGRSAKATVLGTNWLTDVSVLKITDEGEWPFVDLGYSSVLKEGEPVAAIGYPISNDQKPLIVESRVIAPTKTLKKRDPWSETLYTACDDEQIARDLQGASGGGIFDNSGNVIGVLSSVADKEVFCARVELFHKNWAELITTNTVQEIDSELLKSLSPGLTKLMADLTNRDPKP